MNLEMSIKDIKTFFINFRARCYSFGVGLGGCYDGHYLIFGLIVGQILRTIDS